ncbi:MAG: HTH domain-containing protein [Candidatus Paceibacterota bacterium]
MIDLITILILTGLVVFLYLQNRNLKIEIERGRKEAAAEVECAVAASGLDDYNARLQQMKEERKDEILDFLEAAGSLSSGDIADRLEVSNRTALRYLNELEEEGRVRQKGSLGRFVRYKINPTDTD